MKKTSLLLGAFIILFCFPSDFHSAEVTFNSKVILEIKLNTESTVHLRPSVNVTFVSRQARQSCTSCYVLTWTSLSVFTSGPVCPMFVLLLNLVLLVRLPAISVQF